MYKKDLHPPILYFHSVAPQKNSNWVKSYLTLELKYFEDILKYIKKKKLKTFFISEMDNPKYTVSNSIGLSFDDGYLDNFVYVFPLLRKFNIKATIFVSIDFIDRRDIIRSTLMDVWNNKLKEEELNSWGYLSVKELETMIKSGLVDIQSHTKTHDKYPVSDKIIGFHHPQNIDINEYLAENPKEKPYYINDSSIYSKIPHGKPIFEKKSALLSPRIWINENFKNEIANSLKDFDFNKFPAKDAYKKVFPIIEKCRNNDEIIGSKESYNNYIERIKHEICDSKIHLEQLLKKPINVICWPNGDFNKTTLEIARKAGFNKIHYVEPKSNNIAADNDLFTRIGISSYRNKRYLSLLRSIIRINNYKGIFPYKQLISAFHFIKQK